MVSVSLLGYFSSVSYYSKNSHPSFPLSIGGCHIQEYFKNKIGRKRKFVMPHQEKARNEEKIKRSKVIVRENFVVGYWELIPIEPRAELSALQDTDTVRVTKEIPEENKQRTSLWMK